MDACACITLTESCHEERRAGRGLEIQGATEVALRAEVHDEHVGGEETLFLDAGGGEKDVWAVADGDATAGAGYLWGLLEVIILGVGCWCR